LELQIKEIKLQIICLEEQLRAEQFRAEQYCAEQYCAEQFRAEQFRAEQYREQSKLNVLADVCSLQLKMSIHLIGTGKSHRGTYPGTTIIIDNDISLANFDGKKITGSIKDGVFVSEDGGYTVIELQSIDAPRVKRNR
jgi:hypothetical protein